MASQVVFPFHLESEIHRLYLLKSEKMQKQKKKRFNRMFNEVERSL